MTESLGDAAQTRKVIEQTLAAMHELEGERREFITRPEFGREMDNLERRLDVRLENAMLKTRNWVLTGIVASSMMFGAGFLSMMSKIDRMAEGFATIQTALETRRDWIDESNERDRRQDDALKALRPGYVPQPFEVRPR